MNKQTDQYIHKTSEQTELNNNKKLVPLSPLSIIIPLSPLNIYHKKVSND